jgi:hypothetical protein
MVDSRNKLNKRSQSNRNIISKVDLGTISELQAVNLLIQSGFYVARSCHTQSPFDLIAVDECGRTLLIDVKTKSYRKKNNCKIIRVPNKLQRKMSVQIMIIDQKRTEDREEQKEFFKKLKNMLNTFPSKSMFEQKDTHNGSQRLQKRNRKKT